MRATIILAVMLLSACGLEPSVDRIFDADEEFAKLDGPDVPTVQRSLERAALDAISKGENERAAGLYQQLIDHDPKQIRFKLGMAESLRRINEYKAAIAFYDMVIQEQPNQLDAYEGKALALMGKGDTENAARLFKKVIQYDDKRWRSLNALGILFAIKKMPKEAVVYFEEALKFSEDNASVLNNLALIQAMNRQYRQSYATFKKASRNSAGRQQKQVELNHALVLGISGDLDGAESLASKHLDDGALQNNLGLYAHLANNRELAKSYLNMALTGTSVHYKRAWENLNIIANEGKSPGREGRSFQID